METADEVFVTNAMQELVPISKLENTKLPGNSGGFYQKLHKAYIEAIYEMKEGTREWN
jgi:4-amino-4-deoxychorismate lyase